MSPKTKSITSWALYDWANSAFATVVMAGFYPVFLKSYWGNNLEASESTFYLGIANAIASLFIVVFSPILGGIADQCGKKKGFLILFAFIGIINTAVLGLLSLGQWQLALMTYALAVIGFMGANVFYDAMMLCVVKPNNSDKVSALGYGLGYLGGGLVMLFCVLLTTKPDLFGLANATEGVKLSFFIVAIWWAVFTLPLVLFVKENTENSVSLKKASVNGLKNALSTFKIVLKNKPVKMFLFAYWLYIDGVDTVVRMAVDFGLTLGFDQSDLIGALLITQFVGFPAAIAFGYLGGKIGAKKGITIGIFVYALITIWGAMITEVWEFYALAILIGLVQGGVQSLSRSFFATLVPKNHEAQYFGFYNMMGKFATVIGPLMIGTITLITGDIRLGFLSLLLLFGFGMFFLKKV